MTNRFLLLAFAVLLALTAGDRGWAQSAGGASQPQFMTSSLTGVCGFTAASTNVNPASGTYLEPRAIVGTLDFNGAGGVTLSYTENKAGIIQTAGPLSGSYAVGADGRTGSIDFPGPTGVVLQFEVVNGGAALRLMNTGPVDPTAGIVKEVLLAICQF